MNSTLDTASVSWGEDTGWVNRILQPGIQKGEQVNIWRDQDLSLCGPETAEHQDW